MLILIIFNGFYVLVVCFVSYLFQISTEIIFIVYYFIKEFCTSHDHIVAQIIANDLLDQYLMDKVNTKDKNDRSSISQVRKLEWTAPKVALIELLYALYQTKCFNGGQSDLSEIFRWAESSLNINLGNYHKTLSEIRLRKGERTKFLSLLDKNLKHFLDDLDI
ncbi:RteC domain-containing protein [Chryseobacterium sp. P1-3]|uniref:RteC domain-containing protein n=1 Tax=Chryseobacterium sp. (strain P1-3) TaxID=1517683 RepID=UPI000AA58AA5